MLIQSMICACIFININKINNILLIKEMKII